MLMTPITPFATLLPRRTRFGRGESQAAAPEIAMLGARILLVHGRTAERAAPLTRALAAEGCTIEALACPGEPTVAMLDHALEVARAHAPDAVVALGGGAALDLGKAVAALLPAAAAPLDHLEIVGAGKPLPAPPLPFVAIPTTAGTGSEATKNAVIAVPESARKVSLRDDRMVPRLAVIDPALTDGTPPRQTLSSGADAVTQVIEPFLSARATPFTDALCRPAIGDGLAALAALADAESPGARDRLAYVAHVSGVALANAGLGAVHGLAGVLGGETGEPHGEICARLLPHALAALRASCTPGSPLAERMAVVDAAITDALGIAPGELGGWLAEAGLAPRDPPLPSAQRARIAAEALGASSIRSSPIAFDEADLVAILAEAGW
jgi:alcohol dehydrogenase class IV